jgi:hypothetical protein
MSAYTKSNHRHRGAGDGAQIAFGDLATAPQFGTVALTFAAETFKTVAVTFPKAFPSTPVVVVSMASANLAWYQVAAINATASGFTFGASVSDITPPSVGGTPVTGTETGAWCASV